MSQLTIGVVGGVSGLILAWIAMWVWARMTRGSLTAASRQLLADAQVEKERLLRAADIEAKEALLQMQREVEKEVQARRDERQEQEGRLRQRETNIERKSDLLDKRERDLKRRENAIQNGTQRCERMLEEAAANLETANKELERIAALSEEEARRELLASLEDAARKEAAVQIKRIEEGARETARDNAQRIVASAIQRFAGEYVSEKTVSVVELPSDDMKGRIIGREGRNIRALENATGVDVIIDDTPEVVIVSAFNPVRRHIAKVALERLVADGRVHPARIEEVVERATEEIEEEIQRAGEQATFDLGLHGVHPELLRLVGKLRFRTLAGQNVWNHSVETAAIAGMMATELGLNPTPAKRAGLLHDVGRAVDHEVDGEHAQIAAEHARRFGEKPNVVKAIRHHHDADPPTVLAVLLQAANNLSKARPGARRDLLDTYIKRLEDLERIGMSFKGVEKAFAIQSGREIRVMVDYAQVSDDEAFVLSRDIAKRIEEELTYPGEIQVTVLREARATEIAH